MRNCAAVEGQQARCLCVPGHSITPPLVHLRADGLWIVQRAEHDGYEAAANFGWRWPVVATEDVCTARCTEVAAEMFRRAILTWSAGDEREVLFADIEPRGGRRT